MASAILNLSYWGEGSVHIMLLCSPLTLFMSTYTQPVVSRADKLCVVSERCSALRTVTHH